MIQLTSITKNYRQGECVDNVLNDIDLTIEAGEVLAMLGPSGSGKTTLMNIIGLLDRASSGRYFLNEQDISTLNQNQLAVLRNYHIGFVFQAFFLLPKFSALDNVCLPLHYRNLDKKTMYRRAEYALERVGLAKFKQHKPFELSGGQRQRVAIARAFVGEPKIMLADEPTGSLDTHTSHDILNLLLELNRQNKTTLVIVTHDLAIAKCCKRKIALADGKLRSL